MRSFLSRISGTPKARITIRPDHDYVFLSGHEEEARGQHLRGKVVIFISRGENIKGVQLKMTGRMFVGEHKEDNDDLAKWEITDFVLHEWDPFFIQGASSQQSAHGNTYEWPFDVFIPGNQEESFRGCRRCGMTYRLEAFSLNHSTKDHFQTFTPIRIIRRPQESSYELMDPLTTEGQWSGKIKYNVSLGHQAIALGGLVPIDAQIAKLEPTTKFVRAGFFLREHHQVCKDGVTIFEGQRTVMEWPLTLDETNPQIQTWQHRLQLPRMATKCSPDFSVRGVNADHTFHFSVILLDKDGTKSEYETSMPITIFVSPELPLDGWGTFVQYRDESTKEAIDVLSGGIQIPPSYCKWDGDVSNYDGPLGIPPPAYSEI